MVTRSTYTKVTLFLLIALLISSSFVFANNLSITDVFIASQDTSADTAVIQFDISWDNSWRDNPATQGANYDAVWVFVKYDNGSGWEHATLSASGTTPTGFSTGTDGDTVSASDEDAIEIIVPTDKLGCFIQRSAYESGTLDRDSVQITWDYGVDGISTDADIEDVGLKVFGIEMVYIPQGSFFLGDTQSDYGQFEYETDGTSFEVTSEDAIVLGNAVTGSLGNNNATGMSTADDFDDTTEKQLPATFPKGYDAFYLMKYELSQKQYADFLNCLTQAQQATRVDNVSTNYNITSENAATYFIMSDNAALTNRQAIKAGPDPANGEPYTFGCDYDDDEVLNESGDGQWIAMNYISWMDGCAYADWAGLRPMTELEFEKACRGVGITPVADEYAWGTATVAGSAYTLSNAGQATEEINANYSTSAGNASYSATDGAINGPLRVGIFAGDTSNDGTRMVSGAGYYGNMELSGNLYERTVTVGNSTGRAFLGTQGNGELNSTGNADIADWPGYSSGEVTLATGSGFRGGTWANTGSVTQVSDRYNAVLNNTDRRNDSGYRCVRTSP